jgi:hypothetical protein
MCKAACTKSRHHALKVLSTLNCRKPVLHQKSAGCKMPHVTLWGEPTGKRPPRHLRAGALFNHHSPARVSRATKRSRGPS